MTDLGMEFMGRDPYVLPLTVSTGEAVGLWLRHKHPTHTAKLVARDIGSDPRTAENIIAGHLSAATITKLTRAYGWRFWAEIGSAVIGETHAQAINRELEDIDNDRRELEEQDRALRLQREALRARGSVDRGQLRLVVENDSEPRGEASGGR